MASIAGIGSGNTVGALRSQAAPEWTTQEREAADSKVERVATRWREWNLVGGAPWYSDIDTEAGDMVSGPWYHASEEVKEDAKARFPDYFARLQPGTEQRLATAYLATVEALTSACPQPISDPAASREMTHSQDHSGSAETDFDDFYPGSGPASSYPS